MGTLAPVVLEIFEKTGEYVNTIFLQKQIFFQNSIKITKKITCRCKIQSPTRCFHSNGKFVCYFCSKFCRILKKKKKKIPKHRDNIFWSKSDNPFKSYRGEKRTDRKNL